MCIGGKFKKEKTEEHKKKNMNHGSSKDIEEKKPNVEENSALKTVYKKHCTLYTLRVKKVID